MQRRLSILLGLTWLASSCLPANGQEAESKGMKLELEGGRIILVAPKGSGTSVRANFLAGSGINAIVSRGISHLLILPICPGMAPGR